MSSFNVLRREIQRRRVIRACIVYLVVCWTVLQVTDITGNSLGFDKVLVSRILIAIGVAGFPFFAVFSWFYSVSTSGITRIPPFVERRILRNIAPLDDRRKEAPPRGNPARPEATYSWVLEIESGPLAGQRYGVDADIVIGRSTDCDLTFPVTQISRQHARFIVDGDYLLIEDLGSSNGTKVNGNRISAPVKLNHQDKVEILDVIIRVKEGLARPRALDSTVWRDATVLKQ
jgi:hypothetical protein